MRTVAGARTTHYESFVVGLGLWLGLQRFLLSSRSRTLRLSTLQWRRRSAWRCIHFSFFDSNRLQKLLQRWVFRRNFGKHCRYADATGVDFLDKRPGQSHVRISQGIGVRIFQKRPQPMRHQPHEKPGYALSINPELFALFQACDLLLVPLNLPASRFRIIFGEANLKLVFDEKVLQRLQPGGNFKPVRQALHDLSIQALRGSVSLGREYAMQVLWDPQRNACVTVFFVHIADFPPKQCHNLLTPKPCHIHNPFKTPKQCLTEEAS